MSGVLLIFISVSALLWIYLVFTEKKCPHEDLVDGPRVPAVYGSYATKLCKCGAWRLDRGIVDEKWRTDSLEEAAKDTDDDC